MSYDTVHPVSHKDVVLQGATPKIPNAETQAAMREAKEGEITRYNNAAEMFKDLAL